MRVVIDCNIWVMALSSRSVYHPIISQLMLKGIAVVVSNEILLEYEEIISQKYDHDTLPEVFTLYLRS